MPLLIYSMKREYGTPSSPRTTTLGEDFFFFRMENMAYLHISKGGLIRNDRTPWALTNTCSSSIFTCTDSCASYKTNYTGYTLSINRLSLLADWHMTCSISS